MRGTGPRCVSRARLAAALGTVGREFGLVLGPRASGRVLHQQEGLLGLAVAHDALLVLRLADALQAQVAPAAQDERAQGGDGDEGDDDGHHPCGGAVVHDGHGRARGARRGTARGRENGRGSVAVGGALAESGALLR